MQPLTVSATAGAAGSGGAHVTTAPATLAIQRMYLPALPPVAIVMSTASLTCRPAAEASVAPPAVGPDATVVARTTLRLVPSPCSRTSSWSGSVLSVPDG